MHNKTTMVIPTYWTRDESIGPKEGDDVYDHPVPLNRNGTLKRLIESLSILEDRDFDLVIIAVSNARDIEPMVEKKVAGIISSVSSDIPIHLFSYSHLNRLHEILNRNEKDTMTSLLSLRGYSNIRNMCIFLPHVLGSDIAVLIDDDEVFEDKNFMKKAREFIGQTIDGEFIGAVGGYYLQENGDWRLKKDEKPWDRYWNKTEVMNKAFEEIIGKGPRLKQTPFVFGGNMVIHREIFTRIPFDPRITRGEDIDYLINVKMFGHKFFLDNLLTIKHLPPPKFYPVWMRHREDILRFVFERSKLRGQEPIPGLSYVTVEELDPYPGAFLKDDLGQKVKGASELLAEYYRKKDNMSYATEALKNIDIMVNEVNHQKDAFKRIVHIKEQWEAMMKFVATPEIRTAMKDVLYQLNN